MTRIIRAPLSILAAVAFVVAMFGPLAAPQGAHAQGSIKVNIQTMGPGTGITVTGAGFHPGDAVAVFVDVNTSAGPQRVQTGASVAANGTFSANLHIPNNAVPGTYTVTAKDYHGASATLKINVLETVTLTAGAKPVGATLTAGQWFFVNGVGYKPGESVKISASFPLYSGNSLAENRTVTANSNGAFSIALHVPDNASATTVNLTATGAASGKSAALQANVVYHPTLSATQQVPPGGTIKISGTGYVPGSTVHVTVNTTQANGTVQTLSRDVTAGSKGGIYTTITLPGNIRTGTYTVNAVDNTGNFKAATTFNAVVKAAISVSPGSVTPGGNVTVKGSGFPANAAVTVSTNFALYGGGNRTVTTQVHTDGNGNFTATVRAPAHAASARATVVAQSGGARATAQIAIGAIKAGLSVSPNSIGPAGTLTVTGGGYLADATVTISVQVHVANGGVRTISKTVKTDKNGRFATRIQLPADVSAGTYTVTAASNTSGRSTSARFSVAPARTNIAASPAAVIPGGTLTITGDGYLNGDTVTVSAQVKLNNGSTKTLSQTVTTDSNGRFTAHLQVPADAVGGTYNLSASSHAYGRTSTTHFGVAALKPSVVVVPTMAAPGTPVQVNGFGFAAGSSVNIDLNGTKVGTVTTDGSGKFTFKFTADSSLATGTYTVTASSNDGRVAKISLAVNRQVSTHFYIASEYTGTNYHEYIAFLNPTQTQARVTITYDLKGGSTKTKSFSVAPHSRMTEDVNGDLGAKVSAAAAIASDVPIIAERVVFHQYDGSIVPAVTAPATSWYFANGNTGHGYREYIAMQNPNNGPVQVALHIMPTHSRAFTVYRTLPPTSRVTVKVNSLVKKDAVGVTLTSNGPIVANRTIFIKRGMTSKIGVTAPHSHWYFAAGPSNGSAHYWIGAVNPTNHRAYVTVRAYAPNGTQVGSASGWLKPYGRAGYLINKIAHRTDAAVTVTSSSPIVAEQTTYVGKNHDQSTDTFGVSAPNKTWDFAAVNTTSGDHDALDLFNPNLLPVPVVVQFMSNAGITTRTYVVNPLSHTSVDVNSVMPNAQIGIVAASNSPVVVLNRYTFNNGLGSATSSGVNGS